MSADDSKILNYVIRMVVPMRREFGRELNVQHFLHDFSYARTVLAEALSSQDARLRQYAEYVQAMMLGPRVGAPAAPTPLPPSAPAARASDAWPSTAPAGLGSAPATAQPPASAPPQAPTPGSTSVASVPLSPEEELKARILKKYTSGLR